MEGTENAGATPNEVTESSEESKGQEKDQGKEVASKEGAPPAKPEEEFETVRSAGREWKLPKEAAKAFREMERWNQNTSKKLAEINKKAILEEDPDKIIEKALEKKGLKLSDYAEQVLSKHLEELGKSPIEKELEQYRAQAREAAERQENEKKTLAEKADEELTNYVASEVDKEITKALQGSGLPPKAHYAKKAAAYVYDSINMFKQGQIPRILTAVEAASILKSEEDSSLDSRISQLDLEQLYERIGQQKWNELKQWELARLQGTASKAGLVKNSFGSSMKEPSQRQSNRPLTEKEYKQRMEEGA